MKQVWPRPDGFAPAIAVCQSRYDRLVFSHPRALGMLGPGVAGFIVAGVLLYGAHGDAEMLGLGYLLLAGALGLTLAGLAGLWRWWREDGIARTGADAAAEIVSLRAGGTSISYRRPYKLRYKYRDAGGHEHTGKARVVGTSWESFSGQSVLVRYDRQDPGRSAIVWNTQHTEMARFAAQVMHAKA